MNEFDDRVNLGPLDPGSEDPGHWLRFHGRVMNDAALELARRRDAVEWSVPEVVFQWRKALVPVTLLAATLAGIFVASHEEPRTLSSPIALEDFLMEGLSGDPIPDVLEREAELDELAFLTSAGGFTP